MTLARRLVSGSAWVTISTVLTQLAGFVTIGVVARDVDAKAFGTVAIVAVTIELTRELVSAGLPDYLIRTKHWDNVLASTIFRFQLCLALGLATTMFGVGFVIERQNDGPLGLVFMVLAPTYLIDAAASVFRAKMQHDLRFRAMATCSVLAAVIASLAGVSAALSGLGVWALVLHRLVGTCAGLGFMASTARWRPTRDRSSRLRPTLMKSSRLAGANLLGSANLRITDFIVGSMAGLGVLGVYQIASKGLDLVLSTVVIPSQRVALSGFAAVADPARMAPAMLRVIRASSLIAFPTFTGLSALSPEFIAIVFGPGWDQAVGPMSLLALVGAPALLTYLLAPILTAVDRPTWLLGFAAGMTVLSALSAMALSPFGIVAIAGGFLARSVLGGIVAAVLLRRAIGVSLRGVLTALAPAATASVALFATIALLRGATDSWSVYAQAIALGVAGTVSYVAVLATVWRGPVSAIYRDVLN